MIREGLRPSLLAASPLPLRRQESGNAHAVLLAQTLAPWPNWGLGWRSRSDSSILTWGGDEQVGTPSIRNMKPLTKPAWRRATSALVLPLVALALPATLALATAGVRLSVTSGPPTTATTVTGRSFGASETVDIRFDTRIVSTAATDPTGAFSKKITVPASALPGSHQVKVKGETSGLQANATFTVRTDWPQFHFDLANSGLNPYENVLSSSNVGQLVQEWVAAAGPPGSNVPDSPVVSRGLLYVGVAGPAGTGHAYLDAFDVSTGTIVWQQQTNGFFTSDPTVSGGVVYIGMGDHTVRAYKASTGTALWTFTAGGAMRTPAVSGGLVYVGSADNKFYALSAATGTEVWSIYSLGGIFFPAPAVVGGVVYTGADDRRVYALDAATGATIWTVTTGGGITSSPAVASGVVYVGSDDDKLYAIDAATGTVLWTATTGGVVWSSPAVAGGIVYVGSADFSLYAFDASTGALLWSVPTGNSIALASPSVANGVVYQGSEDQKIYAVDAATGAVLWTADTGNAVNGTPAVSDGVVYIGSEDGNVHAYHLP